jgi:hypothetical protein
MSSLEIKHNLKFKGFNPIVLTHAQEMKKWLCTIEKNEWDKTLL